MLELQWFKHYRDRVALAATQKQLERAQQALVAKHEKLTAAQGRIAQLQRELDECRVQRAALRAERSLIHHTATGWPE